MRIAIVGAGGVGGLLAGLLARAGHEVLVVARGAHALVIREGGIRVDSPLGRFAARVAAVSEDPGALGRAQAVLVCVKAWQVADLAPRLATLVAADGVVVPLENGVEAASRLAAGLGEERVAGGVVAMLSWIEAPGAVRHVGSLLRVTMGEHGGRARERSERLEALAAALRTAGADAVITEDVERATWDKFLLIEPWGSVAAAARAPLGVVLSVPETRALLDCAMQELAALARSRGVALAQDAVARTLALLEGVQADATASMQRDIGAGRPSELEDQTGAVVRLAREAGLGVPAHEAILAALLPQERAARAAIARFDRT